MTRGSISLFKNIENNLHVSHIQCIDCIWSWAAQGRTKCKAKAKEGQRKETCVFKYSA